MYSTQKAQPTNFTIRNDYLRENNLPTVGIKSTFVLCYFWCNSYIMEFTNNFMNATYVSNYIYNL